MSGCNVALPDPNEPWYRFKYVLAVSEGRKHYSDKLRLLCSGGSSTLHQAMFNSLSQGVQAASQLRSPVTAISEDVQCHYVNTSINGTPIRELQDGPRPRPESCEGKSRKHVQNAYRELPLDPRDAERLGALIDDDGTGEPELTDLVFRFGSFTHLESTFPGIGYTILSLLVRLVPPAVVLTFNGRSGWICVPWSGCV